LRRRVKRDRLLALTANVPACVIGMEACNGAHHLRGLWAAQGHTPRLMPPQYVTPFVKSKKNDYRDAEANAEAVRRPTMRFVPIEEPAQLDLQTIHRVRHRLVGRRTALVNQLRAILLERGITVPQRRRVLEKQLPGILAADSNDVSPRIHLLIKDIQAEWHELDARIDALDAELIATAKNIESCRRLCEIPGIGALNATALVSAVSNGAAFGKDRDMGGLVGVDTARVFDGREATTSRNQQAGKQVPADPSDPGRPSGVAVSRDAARCPRRVVAEASPASASQRGHRCSRQQTRPHRLGGAERSPGLSATSGMTSNQGAPDMARD
jgi:transposase